MDALEKNLREVLVSAQRESKAQAAQAESDVKTWRGKIDTIYKEITRLQARVVSLERGVDMSGTNRVEQFSRRYVV